MSNCKHGLEQNSCAYCKDMFDGMEFTHVFSSYKGNPIMEILKNGDPFWEDLPGAKKNFRFGTQKAHMLLDCIPIIQEFYHSKGIIPNITQPPIIVSNSIIECKVSRHVWNGHPYLKIVDDNMKVINFGLLKSKSIIELKHKIKHFIDNYS